MNKKEKERTWTQIYTIGEDAGGYWYGSARDDGFIGFLNGCWLVDLLCLWVTGNSRRSYYLFFRTPLPVPVPPIMGTLDRLGWGDRREMYWDFVGIWMIVDDSVCRS